jgi:predicted nucleic acid-binding protein
LDAVGERVVINTGPLIAIARAGVVDELGKLNIEFISPLEVQQELIRGRAMGHRIIDIPWVRWTKLKQPPSPIVVASLDEGEAAVLQLALDEGVRVVCIDERKGRRQAMAVGLTVTGTLGLLIKAKTNGALDAVRPCIERMTQQGIYFDPQLVRRVLTELGE